MTHLCSLDCRSSVVPFIGLSLSVLLSSSLTYGQSAATEPQVVTDAEVLPVDPTQPTGPVEVWTSTPEDIPSFPPPDSGVFASPSVRPAAGPPVAGLRPRIYYRYQYAEGIPNGPGERHSSHVHEFTPGILWHIGERLQLDYAPSFIYYSNDAIEDSIDHSLALTWNTHYEAWRFDAAHRYRRSNSVLIETGSQSKRENFLTTVGALRELNSRWAWESRLNHHSRQTETLQDFGEYAGEQRLLYSVSERLGLSLAAAYGYVKVDDGSNHEYIRPRFTVDYRPGEKLSLRGWAGAENRWYKNGLETTSPVYQVSANYLPVEATQLTLSYGRAIQPSYFEDAVTRRRAWDVSLTQRFLGRYFLTVRASRQDVAYSTITPSAIDGRHDVTTSYSARLSTPIRDRGFIAVFYEPESDNESNRDAFTYSLRTYGVEGGWQF